MSDSYVVVAPYVTVRTMTMDGPRIIGLFAGAPIPADADPGWCERHAEAKMIAKVADPAVVPDLTLSPVERNAIGERGDNPNEVLADRVAAAEKPSRSRAAAPKPDAPKGDESK